MEDNCHVDPFQKDVNEQDLENAQVAYLVVEGMGCPRCAMRVQNGLNRLEGVFEATVLLENHTAEVFYDAQRVQVQDLINAVAMSGDNQKHRYRAQALTA